MTRRTVEQRDAGYPRVSTTMHVERDGLQNQVQALEAYGAAHDLNLRLYPEGASPSGTSTVRSFKSCSLTCVGAASARSA